MKKNKKSIFIAIIVLFVVVDLVLVYFNFFKDNEIKKVTYSNKYLSFEYTSDYAIKVHDDNKISIGKDEKSGQIDIVITELTSEMLLKDHGFIIYEATQKFVKENEEYYQNYYGSYKTSNYEVNDFLYDTDDGKQVDMNYIIANKKLVLISYANTNEYFDVYEPYVLELIKSIKIS